MRATLSFNLFDGFQRRTELQNASIQVKSGELLERQARLDLERDLANAYESYRNSLTVLDLEERNLESAKVNFRRTRELYGLGRVTSTQFREAQLNLIRAETNVSNATYTAKLDEIELLRITGKLLSEAE
jgi:outer membrane protein